MPRAKRDDDKTSAELDAELKAMKAQMEAKRKARDAAKKREDAEDRRNRELAERDFNRRFVEKSKVTKLQSGRTVYEWISALMEQDQTAKTEEQKPTPPVDDDQEFMRQVSDPYFDGIGANDDGI